MAKYITLTATHIVTLMSNGRPRANKLDKEREMMFPLGQVLLMQAGDSPFAELSFPGNLSMSWICAELYGDVKSALLKGAANDSEVILVPRTVAIVEGMAEHQASSSPAKSEPKRFPMPGKVADIMRKPDVVEVPDLGGKTVGTVGDGPVAEPLGTPEEIEAAVAAFVDELDKGAAPATPEQPLSADDKAKIDEAWKKHAAAKQEAGQGTWDDVMPASSRQVKSGDLRIVELARSSFCVEIAETVEGGFEWTRQTLKTELRAYYRTWADAAQAIRQAGLAHRLIDQEENAA